MSDEQTSRVGSNFGPYRLKRLLGRGGMGEVYEAEHTVKEWTVAVKLLSESFSKDPVFRERMKREARTAGRLQEPHVVPIHDYGEIDGQMFLEMRLIEGTDLDSVLKRFGPLAPPRAVAIITQIASALDAAHAAGVMHRDVKPQNILITRDDFAYLVDFGIASATTDEKLTQLGTAVGTWKYMAPERFSNAEVTYRADIYALACVLYECLTGTPPYRADSASVLVTAHMMDPIPQPTALRGNRRRARRRRWRGVRRRGGRRRRRGGRRRGVGDRRLGAERGGAGQGRFLAAAQDGGGVVLVGVAERVVGGQRQIAGATWGPPPPGTPQPFTGPPAWNPPPPPNRRNPWPLIAAVAAVLVVIVGGVGIWLVVRPKPAPPPDPIPAERLNSLLLGVSDINAVMGSSTMEPGKPIQAMDTSSLTVSQPDCQGALYTTQSTVYAGTGFSAVSGLVSSEPGDNYDHWVNQAVVLFPSADKAKDFVQTSAGKWKGCAGKTVTVTNKGKTYRWTFEQVRGGPPKIAVLDTQEGADGWECQRAMSVANNVIVDVNACGYHIVDQGTQIVDKIAAKVNNE
ncbi:serine/threonine protein kinase [Mycobacterium malmoense]|uniref:serine/threonine-protein kinase PknH/PknJ n=1 Tax=Mycobacterium malmoense TaxID=1780 RepID=UPI00080B9406|nr:serine/threonine-protein kinase PknH/PknJ [Mycobacterium malmoense]OCB31236.1 serine/threonine protein kinase [Mycobacterium malmoense]